MADDATPVLVVGAGLSGLATALGAALGGRRVEVFEAADLVGGAAAYSGGQVWVGDNHVARREGMGDDTLELAERYVRAIAHSHPEVLDEKALLAMADHLARRDPALGGRRCHPVDGDPRARRLPQRGGRCPARGPLPDQRGRGRQHPR